MALAVQWGMKFACIQWSCRTTLCLHWCTVVGVKVKGRHTLTDDSLQHTILCCKDLPFSFSFHPLLFFLSNPPLLVPSLVPETTIQTTTSTTPPLTGDRPERTNKVTTRPTVEPTTGSLLDTASPTPYPNTSSKPSSGPQSQQSLSIYYILIIVLSALTCLILSCIVGVCVYLCVDYKRKQQSSINIYDQGKETDSSSSTPV